MQLPHIPTWSPLSPLGNLLSIHTWQPTANPHLPPIANSHLATFCQSPLGHTLPIPTWPPSVKPRWPPIAHPIRPPTTHCNLVTHCQSPLCHQLLIDPLSLIMLFANKRPLSPYLFNAFCNALRCSRTRTVLKLSST